MLCEQMLDLGFGREPVLEFVAGGKTALLGTRVRGGRNYPLEFLGRKFGPGVPALRHISSLAPCALHDFRLWRQRLVWLDPSAPSDGFELWVVVS